MPVASVLLPDPLGPVMTTSPPSGTLTLSQVRLCAVGRSIVISDAFVAAAPETERARLVSVGRYALRGVGRSQELFTLDPGLLRD